MRKLTRTLLLIGLGLLAVTAIAVGAALATGQASWLLLLLAALLIGSSLVVGLGLRGSHGGLVAFLRGQFRPPLHTVPRIVHLSAAEPVSALAEVTVDLARPVAQISERFVSVAVDLSQVVGGKWWDPAADHVELSSGSLASPVLNFDRPLLDRLTAALAPLYLRVGGSESDKVFYRLDDDPTVPPGYQSALTRRQWDRLHAFCARNGCELVFTLNAGPAARHRDGFWNPANAQALMEYAAAEGQRVAVWELGNELNVFFFVHGLRHQVSVAQYCRDLQTLCRLRDRRRSVPQALVAGPGSAYWPVLGQPLGSFFGFSEGTLKRAAGLLDLFTWHYYPQQSRRCPLGSRRAHPGRLLDPRHLDEAAYWAERLNALRDRLAPGLPIWLGETGNAQCGGAPGLSDTYLAGLWWLDQLGLLARLNHPVVVRQSLTGMDYGLLDEASLTPRPDYWNSLLWRRLMGRTVYRVQVTGPTTLRTYAHANPAGDGLCLLAINLDPQRSIRLRLPQYAASVGETYLLTAPDLLGGRVWLNGRELALGPAGQIPAMQGVALGTGEDLVLPPLAYGFLVLPG